MKNSMKELMKVAAMSSIVGAVTVSAVKRPQEAKTAKIISEQRNSLDELKAKIGFLEERAGRNEGGEAGAGADDGRRGDGSDDVCPGGVADSERGIAECTDELRKCQTREMGRFMNDLYMCGKMADAALYLKSIRNTVSCNTSRQIHSLIGMGLERCGEAKSVSRSEEERRLVDKEVRRLEVLRADKKVNPASCVKAK